jgi:hypothetical protein
MSDRNTEITERGEEPTIVRPHRSSVLEPGELLGHTYEIVALLARGGMGEVYRARHRELGTEHAVKVILPSLANDPKMVRLLIEEARKLGRIRHDAIVNYEGLFRDEQNLLYLVMEYVEGESLAVIAARRKLEPGEVLRLRDRLAQGLAAAHEKGIIHRDISPENIILPGGDVDRAKLIDFGIAKSADAGESTVIGADFAGKYSYVSPEQAGLFGAHVDLRSDIYSLGLVLATAALGKKLDMGSSPSTVIAARQRVPDLSALPASLRPVIGAMLQPRPDDRPASMRALLGEGMAAPAAAPPSPAAAPVRRTPPRRGLLAPIAAAVVVAIGLLGAAAAYFRPWTPSVSVPELQAGVAGFVAGYSCAALDYAIGPDRSVTVSGFIPTAADRDRLRGQITGLQGAGKTKFDVRLRPWPFCELTALLAPLATADAGAPVLALASGAKHAYVDQRLTLDARMPDFDGFVYLDYWDEEGKVLHLLPNDRQRLNLRPARNQLVFAPKNCWSLGGNTGEQLVTLIAASKRLFSPDRPEVENAKDYLASLKDALGNPGDGQRAAALLFFDLRDDSPQPIDRTARCPPL